MVNQTQMEVHAPILSILNQLCLTDDKTRDPDLPLMVDGEPIGNMRYSDLARLLDDTQRTVLLTNSSDPNGRKQATFGSSLTSKLEKVRLLAPASAATYLHQWQRYGAWWYLHKADPIAFIQSIGEQGGHMLAASDIDVGPFTCRSGYHSYSFGGGHPHPDYNWVPYVHAEGNWQQSSADTIVAANRAGLDQQYKLAIGLHNLANLTMSNLNYMEKENLRPTGLSRYYTHYAAGGGVMIKALAFILKMVNCVCDRPLGIVLKNFYSDSSMAIKARTAYGNYGLIPNAQWRTTKTGGHYWYQQNAHHKQGLDMIISPPGFVPSMPGPREVLIIDLAMGTYLRIPVRYRGSVCKLWHSPAQLGLAKAKERTFHYGAPATLTNPALWTPQEIESYRTKKPGVHVAGLSYGVYGTGSLGPHKHSGLPAGNGTTAVWPNGLAHIMSTGNSGALSRFGETSGAGFSLAALWHMLTARVLCDIDPSNSFNNIRWSRSSGAQATYYEDTFKPRFDDEYLHRIGIAWDDLLGSYMREIECGFSALKPFITNK